MNYHIMIDDKFIDDFITDAEHVCPENENIYFVRGDKNRARFVNHSLAKWVDIEDDDFRSFLKSITKEDRVFIHWYDLCVGKLMLTINEKVPLFVPLWGGDFYEDHIWHNKNWLYDKNTLSYVNKAKKSVVWARHPVRILKQLRMVWRRNKDIKQEFKLKQQTIKRINYILIDINMGGEVDLVKKLYRANHLQHLPFIYNQNFDLAKSLKSPKRKQKTVVIQIGNSATDTNNHVDLFNRLKRFANEDIRISVPLSYGDPDYAAFVKHACSLIFGGKTEYIENLMPRDEYIKKLLDVDVCVMYHNRSQALGNCITLLTLGKKLYLKKKNPLWDLFDKIGVIVFDADTIKNISFQEFSEPLNNNDIQKNIHILSNTFSQKKRLEYLSKILN